MTDSTEGPQIILRPMTLADLDQVEEIDQACFPMPWPKKAFRYELEQNQNTLCWVAEWFEPGQDPVIVAAIVIWLILDEAHIGTLAVRPAFHGRGIAQRLLARTLLLSGKSGATHAMLEVRASNQAAQQLYLKFGFESVGIRKNYYQDTQEDAILMTLGTIDPKKLADLVHCG